MDLIVILKSPFLANKFTDWQYFQTVFQNSYIPPNEPKTTDDIEEDVEFVTSLIQRTAWERTHNPPDRQYDVSYPAYIRDMIKIKED